MKQPARRIWWWSAAVAFCAYFWVTLALLLGNLSR